jgi:hypothetical protein
MDLLDMHDEKKLRVEELISTLNAEGEFWARLLSLQF